ncbi:putative short chain dehydrogenase reductase family protein [Botrytis fragariae]|uniref:Putative short chain dehydrogenase reductase family protein n=1 Tax=Botrytis fragariae TaxID=1964551 RepID=A0A8H6AK27_9HELO|nr:putative short chain dehydrogenase reductase family protein [Botrytis fragariae]KAF5868723.1 putative short chain dehydrogenase reductase family protein [Botrytis fragariae]
MSGTLDTDAYTTPFAITKSIHRDPYWAIDSKNPTNNQSGKIIIITGASAGLGAAAARVWAEAHASGIVLAARRVPPIDSLIEKLQPISPETKFLSVKVDIANEEDVKNLYETVQKEFGRHADVLLNNAGYMSNGMIGEVEPSDWWKGIEINLKGLYHMTHHFIRSQPSPKSPTGTIITVSSGRAALTGPGGSAYNISKLAEQRLSEHLHLEYPSLRVFTTMPGIVLTAMVSDHFKPYALDHAELTGMLALYLAQERADYLRGGMVGVNWDVEEMEGYSKEIAEKKALQTSWISILPINGGKGLAGLRD